MKKRVPGCQEICFRRKAKRERLHVVGHRRGPCPYQGLEDGGRSRPPLLMPDRPRPAQASRRTPKKRQGMNCEAIVNRPPTSFSQCGTGMSQGILIESKPPTAVRSASWYRCGSACGDLGGVTASLRRCFVSRRPAGLQTRRESGTQTALLGTRFGADFPASHHHS